MVLHRFKQSLERSLLLRKKGAARTGRVRPMLAEYREPRARCGATEISDDAWINLSREVPSRFYVTHARSFQSFGVFVLHSRSCLALCRTRNTTIESVRRMKKMRYGKRLIRTLRTSGLRRRHG